MTLDDATKHISDRVGQRLMRIVETAVSEPAVLVLVSQSPINLPKGGFCVPGVSRDPRRGQQAPRSMRFEGAGTSHTDERVRYAPCPIRVLSVDEPRSGRSERIAVRIPQCLNCSRQSQENLTRVE